MLSFKDEYFEDISPDIRLVDVIVGPPSMDIAALKPAAANKEIFTRKTYGARIVTVLFAILTNESETARKNLLNKVAVWAHSTQEEKLTVPNGGGFLKGVCCEFPSISARDISEVLSLSFRCADPFFDTVSRQVSAMDTPFVNQDFPTTSWWIEQTIDHTLTNPTWDLNNEQIAFSTLTPGKLVIDGEKQTATLNGFSVLPAMLLGSRFFTIQPGTNTPNLQNGAGGLMYWRKRWI